MHLRWAVAEMSIGIDTPSSGLEAAERALAIFCQRAEVLLDALEPDSELLSDACYTAELGIAEARTSLGPACPLRAERARALHSARRKLHRALVVVAEAMAREGGARCSSISTLQAPELGSLLRVRQMLSAFRGAIITAGEQRARLSWALEVVGLELSILRANPLLDDLPARPRYLIEDLARRITAWGLKEADPMLGRSLYREACALPALVAELCAHPLLLEHDEQTLSELSALLANEPSGRRLEHRVLAQLCALRGLDHELDRLELSLIYGAAGALGSLSLRVADLRARLSRPAHAAACWS